MTMSSGTDAASSGDPDLIRADIAQTRAELGDSVEALAAKADVKARAKREAEEIKIRAKETAGQVGRTIRRRPAPVAAALAAVAAAIGAVVLLRKRRTTRRGWRTR
jgi:hypothetical protein